MARPLVKRRKNGEPYRRPPEVESQIDATIRLELPVLLRRAAIQDRDSPDYLRCECLVHLIRDARRRDDEPAMNGLLPILLSRCERMLRTRIRDDSFANVAEVRVEVLSQLGELFAVDGTAEGKNQLDFFECRFNRALMALRVDAVRQEEARAGLTTLLASTVAEGDPVADDDRLARLAATLSRLPTPEDEAFYSELRSALDGLPPDEHKAIVLCYWMGYDIESDDPTKNTAATLCGVTGRTIRNRLARAITKLARFLE